jgi:hypothetical protein
MCTGGTGAYLLKVVLAMHHVGLHVLGQRGQLRAKDLCYSLTS